MNRKFFNYIAFVFILMGCRKEHGPVLGHSPNHSNITSPDLINMKFKSGTYWVFTDSITNTSDSNYIINPLEFMDINSGETYTFQVQTCCNKENYQIVTWGINRTGPYQSTDELIYRPFNTPFIPPASNYIPLDSMFVYDRYYKNVEKTIVDPDPLESNKKVIYYLNADYGFLRKDIFSSSNTLISKKLIIRKNIVR